MAKIYVGTGFRKVSLQEGMRKSRPGDQIILDDGIYDLPDRFEICDLTILGPSPENVILRGILRVAGTLSVSGVTLEALPFQNNIWALPGATVTLSNVRVNGDPAGKYPAIYGRSCHLTLQNSNLQQDSVHTPLKLDHGGNLFAENSNLGGFLLSGGEAQISNCQIGTVGVSDAGRLWLHGLTQSTCPGNCYLFKLSEESSAVVETLIVLDPSVWAAECVDSLLQINSLQLAETQGLTITHSGSGRVMVNHPRVTINDPTKPQEPPMWAKWPLSDNRAFLSQSVAGGGTLVLEAGEYFLDDCENSTALAGMTIEGAGVDATILHGSFGSMEAWPLIMRHLTVKAPAGLPAVSLEQGNAEFDDVAFEPTENTDHATLVSVTNATATVHHCDLRSSGRVFDAEFDIGHGGVLRANNSLLGWVIAYDNGQADLQNCAARAIQTSMNGNVTIKGSWQFQDNFADCLTLSVADSSSITADAFDIGALEIGGSVRHRAHLTVNSLVAAPGGHLHVNLGPEATCTVAESEAFTWDYLPDDVVGDVSTQSDEGVPELNAPHVPADDQVEEVPHGGGHSLPDNDGADGLSSARGAVAELMGLTGLATVKQQIQTFLNMVTFNQIRRSQGLSGTASTMHSLFLGNPGTGKTTVARLLGKALFECGAVKSDAFVEVSRSDLVSENIGGTAILTQAVLKRALGGVLFIDEAYTLAQGSDKDFGQEAIDTILKFMEDHRDEIVLIFAGYDQEMQDFLRSNPGLKSRVPNVFNFEDYSPEEIASIGYTSLISHDFVVDEDLYRQIVSRKYKNSVDGGNGRWVRNFNEQLVQRMAQRIVADSAHKNATAGPIDSRRITDQDLHNLAGGAAEDHSRSVATLLEELDGLVGLAPVKTWVRNLIAEAQANMVLQQRGIAIDRPSYHMLFLGNPGTGKTTVAKLVARIFYHLGLLETSTVIDVDRPALVGRYVGETEVKTTRVIDNAIGGVLFVDEAYQLSVKSSSYNDFGQQAIETMITRLENDRDKFIAIFAGYTKEMQSFLSANEGLRSRIPFSIEFPDYSPEEVAEIVVRRLAGTWSFDQDRMRAVVAGVYAQLPAAERSNGRWARIFAEALVRRHKAWMVTADVQDDSLTRIVPETVHDTATEFLRQAAGHATQEQ